MRAWWPNRCMHTSVRRSHADALRPPAQLRPRQPTPPSLASTTSQQPLAQTHLRLPLFRRSASSCSPHECGSSSSAPSSPPSRPGGGAGAKARHVSWALYRVDRVGRPVCMLMSSTAAGPMAGMGEACRQYDAWNGAHVKR